MTSCCQLSPLGTEVEALDTEQHHRVARKVIVAGERVAKNGVLQTALNGVCVCDLLLSGSCRGPALSMDCACAATRINLIALFLTLVGLQVWLRQSHLSCAVQHVQCTDAA